VPIPADPLPRILVIVRDEPIGEIVVAMLGAAGYQCDALWEHKAILRVLKRIEKYNLLFCQVSALEEDKKLLKWALGAGKHIPVVAFAGRSPEGVPKVIYERCNFLQAPFDREQLLNFVRETLKSKNEPGC
jgi:DNA-binding NtrC family response regulator